VIAIIIIKMQKSSITERGAYMIKHSRNRDAILRQLSGRNDHPTAEMLYNELKPEIPNLSLGTVYRNLKQLVSMGEIQVINSEGASRYDWNPHPHSHFFCMRCGSVKDIDDDNEDIVKLGQKEFRGKIYGCWSNYYGICEECLMKDAREA
jgi:Fur family peroxide stress response transcriptional regulator